MKFNNGDPIIEINQADVYNGASHVLKNVSFTVKKGENIAILGPNGSGKSSLMKLICGDLRPIARDTNPPPAKMFGQTNWNIWSLKAHLGIVTNDLHHQYINMNYPTGKEVVASGFFDSLGIYHNVTDEQQEKVEEIMDFLEIQHLAEKKISHMSSGEGRKCLIGRALVCDPHAMMLDEPTTGLDIKAQFNFIKLMEKVADHGKTIILITHHIEEIFSQIGKIAFISEGTIKAIGNKNDMLTNEHMSDIFKANVKVHTESGFYKVTLHNE